MTFEEAARRYSELKAQRDSGELRPQEFMQLVAQLRLQDSAGKWWQVDAASGNWLSWEGSAWIVDQPPVYPPPPPPAAEAPPVAESALCPSCGTPIRPDRKFCSGCGKPLVRLAPTSSDAKAKVPVAPAIRACPSCGAMTAADRKFCNACGKPVIAGVERLRRGEPLHPATLMTTRAGVGSTAPLDQGQRPIQGATNQAAQAMRKLRAQVMSPQEFLNTARQVPWGERPQGWWDLLSIFGGAASGGLWFLYGSVRATSLGGWFTLLLLVPLILVMVYRRRAAEIIAPLWIKVQNLSVSGKVIAAIAIASSIMLIPKREGFDLISPLLMVAIPTALVWSRKEIDRMLARFQSLRSALPLAVRLGIGMAIPFATAYFLYNGLGVRMYPLMQANTVLGTLLSYAIIRTPASTGSQPGWSPRIGKMGLLLLLGGLFLLWAVPALADDFLRDPFNLNDGLRTDGIAPVLAGVSTAVVTMLVNGSEVARTVIQARSPVGPGETEQHEDFEVVVNTRDNTGAPSTTVKAGTGGVFLLAHCEKAGQVHFPAGDPTISFSLTSGDPWVTLADLGMQNAERCAQVVLADPQPAGDRPQSCSVQVSAGSGGLICTTVDIKIEPDMELEFF
jgi:hypothetical protein